MTRAVLLSRRLARIAQAALATMVVTLVASSLAACEEPPPAKMALRPRGPLVFTNRSMKETVELAFFDAKGRPYIKKPTATFEGFDPGVVEVTVDADSVRATVKPRGTGKTEVVVRAFGLEERLAVEVVLPGSVAFDAATPTKLLLNGKPHQLAIVVKDDKGGVIADPKPNYKASDYCVDVSPDGLVTPQAVGECQVSVDVAGHVARHRFTVE